MNPLMAVVSGFARNPRLTALFLDASIKSLVVLAGVAGVCFCWRRAAAAARHLMWFLALASLPFLPLLSLVQPSWQRPIGSVSTRFNSGNEVALALELAPGGEHRARAHEPQTSPAIPGDPAGHKRAAENREIAARFSTSWLVVAFGVWLCGTALALVSMVVGQVRLGKLSRKAHPLLSADWTLLLKEASETLGLRRRVPLWRSADNIMPLTWGWWRPVVLLPEEAGQWPTERRRIVLLHELAHVKRWDCLTQLVAGVVCSLYWFNPRVWFAARRMCVERERACDDMVLNGGCKASDYASHLVEIARTFRRVPQVAAIAMARPSGLERRVAAIVAASGARRLRPVTVWAGLILLGGLIYCIGGFRTEAMPGEKDDSQLLRGRQIARLESFSAAKEKQSETLAAAAGETISPRFRQFFDAATKGDWQTVTNIYASFKQHHPQYSKGLKNADPSLRTSYWQPVLEICLAYDYTVNCDPQYTQMAIDGIVDSIPAGSIYFGGTDPGRGLPTAFCKSHADANPFFTLTQNALADGSYLEYLQTTYGERSTLLDAFIKVRRSDTELQALDSQMHEAMQTLSSLNNGNQEDPGFKAAEEAVSKLQQRIEDRTKGIWAGLESQSHAQATGPGTKVLYIPTFQDSQKCFQDYLQDATQRLHNHQLKPGEDIEENSGRIQVSGQTAVMSINGLLAKIIFDRNPDHEFYIEESFPLDWMYPHLEPHGLIMKIDRQPLAALPEKVVRRDHEYWRGRVDGMIGDWLTEATSVQAVADFVEKVYVRKDLGGFHGDPRFIQNAYAQKFFSKLRSSLGGLYTWRMNHAADAAEKERMAREADFAFRQAWALCPYSPEAIFRYADFLKSQDRAADASLVTAIAAKFPPAAEPDSPKSHRHAAEPPKSPVFEMRLVADAASDDAQRMTLVQQNITSLRTEVQPLYVQKRVLLDQTDVQSARVNRSGPGGPQIEVTFTDEGRRRFAEITHRNIGKRLAIVMDGRVCSAPVIQSEIPGGIAEIAGSFSDQEAQALADKINGAIVP